MSRKQQTVLLTGDILTLALVTIFGFFSHQMLTTAVMRILATFVPLALSWGMVAPFLGVYDPAHLADARQLWRPFWAMILAAPMAGLLRGIWLGQVILPIFVVILGGISALTMSTWRAVYWALSRRSEAPYG